MANTVIALISIYTTTGIYYIPVVTWRYIANSYRFDMEQYCGIAVTTSFVTDWCKVFLKNVEQGPI